MPESNEGGVRVERTVRRLTKKQKRVKSAIEFLRDYFISYANQAGYLDYSDRVIIDDALYGLGVALNQKHKYADGYDEFKKVLREHLSA